MPRIRTIKPEFWTDGNMVELSPWARLFYIGTWNFALCDHGHLPDDAVALKLRILPADDVDAHQLLDELIKSGRIVRRHLPDGRSYLVIPRFVDHQKLDARWSPRCPYCTAEPEGYTEDHPEPRPNSDETHSAPAEPTEPQPTTKKGSKGKDGTGKDSVRPSAGRDSAPAPPNTAQTLIADWIDHIPKKPPNSVVAQVGKHLKTMLAEGIQPVDVHAGLAEWARKGLHPSSLPSVVNELMNSSPARASPRRPSTSDARVAQALAAGEQVQAQLDKHRAREITDGGP